MIIFDLQTAYTQKITELKKEFRDNFELCLTKEESVCKYKCKRRRLRRFFMREITVVDLEVGESGYINPAHIRQDVNGVERINPRAQVSFAQIPGCSVERGQIKKTEGGLVAKVPITHYYAVGTHASEDWPEISELRMGN